MQRARMYAFYSSVCWCEDVIFFCSGHGQFCCFAASSMPGGSDELQRLGFFYKATVQDKRAMCFTIGCSLGRFSFLFCA